jgi:hypothetical protein
MHAATQGVSFRVDHFDLDIIVESVVSPKADIGHFSGDIQVRENVRTHTDALAFFYIQYIAFGHFDHQEELFQVGHLPYLNARANHTASLDKAHAQRSGHRCTDAGVGNLLFKAFFLGFSGENAQFKVLDLVFGCRFTLDQVGEALTVFAEFGQIGMGS